jgi:hypothetical protein
MPPVLLSQLHGIIDRSVEAAETIVPVQIAPHSQLLLPACAVQERMNVKICKPL